MGIGDWIKGKDSYIEVPEKQSDVSGVKKGIPEGIWSKCAACGEIIFQKDFYAAQKVCPGCSFHYPLSAHERIDFMLDKGSFRELFSEITPSNPLGFAGKKTYEESLETSQKNTGLNEAIVTGYGKLNGRNVVVAIMDFRFIGGSMGSVVGEKVARAIEYAARKRYPMIVVAASGGARMQEGMYSLGQMAKTSAVLAKLAEAKVPYIAVLTHPTTGGVLASFPALADVIIAEPGALVGFTGARVIEQTIREKLPDGFQTAEFMLDHGMVDMVVERRKIKGTISDLLDLFTSSGSGAPESPAITVGELVPGAATAKKVQKTVRKTVKKGVSTSAKTVKKGVSSVTTGAKTIKKQVKRLQGKPGGN